MKKFTFLFFMVFIIIGYVFGKENLAILSFTGGQRDEGETIAELFSFNDHLNDVFNPIPRTSITQAINREQRFQMGSGMTDADTIVAIGHQLGARYVVAGNITSIGSNKLLVISIVDIKKLQQIAGDYQTYINMVDIRGKLPNMAGNIIQATQKNTASLPKLAIVPVQLQGNIDQGVADTLTQILSIHLIRTGKYTVYPRTKSLEQVMEEHKFQFSGTSSDSNIVGIGYGENPNLVLSVVARRLENTNMFNAAIIDLFTGAQVVGRSVDYRDINDGIRAIELLTYYLTGTAKQINQQQQKEEREQKFMEWKAATERNSLDFVSGYLQWGDGLIGGGGSFAISGIHFSPVSFSNIGIETRFGGISLLEEDSGFYFSVSPMLGLIIPINKNVKIFSDAMLELGYFGGMKGTIFDWVTPAFDIGISLLWGTPSGEYPGIDIKYRGTWYDGFYTHSVGITLLFSSDGY